MDDTVLMILFLIGVMVCWVMVHHQYRRWKAGKLADKMLEDVIRGKDAFRR
jgi:hypothetical protein